MKKLIIVLIVVFCYKNGFSQNFIGIKSDYVTYNVKSYHDRERGGYKTGSAMSYSAFATVKYKPLISFGAELGGYQFSIDKNKTTNIFLKPSIIFNGTIGKNIIAVDLGLYLESYLTKNISNPYQNYENTISHDTTYFSEKAFFYRSFAAPFIGISYTRMIGNIGIGIKAETSVSTGGFYKGYDSNFTRCGLFVKYKF